MESDDPTPCLFLLQPSFLMGGIDQFDVKIVLCQEECDISIPKSFAGLRHHNESRAFFFEERDLDFDVITPETKVMKSTTPAGKQGDWRRTLRWLNQLNRQGALF